MFHVYKNIKIAISQELTAYFKYTRTMKCNVKILDDVKCFIKNMRCETSCT